MPTYSDFQVGDVWVQRRGKEVIILHVDKKGHSWPIHAANPANNNDDYWYDQCGETGIYHDPDDLMYKKTNTTSSLSIAARIAASQARVEGMKAKNHERKSNGEALAYDEHDFFAEAQLLEQLADEAGR